MKQLAYLFAAFLVFFIGLGTQAQDQNFHIYLSFGQSNMEGFPSPELQDTDTDNRVLVMQAVDCPTTGRKKGNWYPAATPLTRCNTGLSQLDYFSKTMAASLPTNIKIGVLNVSVGGCKIELFDKENYQTYTATAPEWMQSILKEYDGNPYERLITMAKLAQRDGILKGILLHQGESNTGDRNWPVKVKKVYENLLRDLNLEAATTPLLAGELVHAQQGGKCASMNTIISDLPAVIPTAFVISSKDCEAAPDSIHFNASGVRLLGKRYAAKMLQLQNRLLTEPMNSGKFQPNWESLKQYETPEWFRDAKFGIWAHWGPQCQPAQGDWYARNMYNQGSAQYNWHLANYGHPSQVGFKDVINSWKASNWNPDKLIELYKKAGAQYFFAMANHHDNLDLWNSSYQSWNSVTTGPKKDILAAWEKAARKYQLPFGLSVHAAHAWSWLEVAQQSDTSGPYAGIAYDGKLTKEDGLNTWWQGLDPQELYNQDHVPSEGSTDINRIHSQWNWSNGASIPSEEYCNKFYNRTIEMINLFKPDLLYFDDTGLPLYPISNVGLKIASHFYNNNMLLNNGKLNAVLFGKILTEEQKDCLVWDVERGAPDQIQQLPWQTCSCIGDWHYNESVYAKDRYKSAASVIHQLVDIVSKNGNLLLNIPVKGDGSIDGKEIAILEGIAEWMQINSESIYGTRPWVKFGEGPVAEAGNPINAQGFNEGKNKFSANDIRLNQKGTVLYVTVMGTPNENIILQSLGKRFLQQAVKKIELLGSTEAVKWERTKKQLTIHKPATIPNSIALVYKLHF